RQITGKAGLERRLAARPLPSSKARNRLPPLRSRCAHQQGGDSMGTTARQRTALPRLTDRLPLGSAGLRVSPVCLGIVGEPATVPAAFDAGVNFFFVTADMHWPLYESARRGLADLLARVRGVREQVVVAGVCYPTQPEFCSMPFQELVAAV